MKFSYLKKCTSDILKKFKMDNSKSVFTPIEKKKLTREIDEKGRSYRDKEKYFKIYISS